MKKLLLLIPFIFLLAGCGPRVEYGTLEFYNELGFAVVIKLADSSEETRELSVWAGQGYRFTNYPINRKYTLKVKNKKKPLDDWTTFVIYPTHSVSPYYIFGNESKIIMTSAVWDGKSEDIKRIPPATETQ